MNAHHAPWLRIDREQRRVSIDPTHPQFYNDPYATYERVRAVAPVFYWSEQRVWCFMNAADVGAIMRDRRFGRELLPLPGQPRCREMVDRLGEIFSAHSHNGKVCQNYETRVFYGQLS